MAHRKRFGKFDNRRLTGREMGKDRPACRIRESGKSGVKALRGDIANTLYNQILMQDLQTTAEDSTDLEDRPAS